MEMGFKRNTDFGQLWLSLNEKFPKRSAINKVILFPGAFESDFLPMDVVNNTEIHRKLLIT